MLSGKPTRDDIQAHCSTFPKDRHVCLYWSPRVGKTKAALNLLGGESVLVVSNSELIRDSWKKELENYSGKWKSICYQSLKNEGTGWATFILDEADLISENYRDLLKEISEGSRFVFLTGTPTFRLNQIVSQLCKDPIKWTITMQEAIDFGILPEPSIICLGLKLREVKECLFQIGKDKKKQIRYVKYGEHFKFLKDKSMNLGIQCSEKEWVELINAEVEYWKEIVSNYRKLANMEELGEEGEEYLELKKKVSSYHIPQQMALNILKQKGLLRKNFLSDKKNRYILRLLKYFKVENERVLIFANSIPQTEFIDSDCAIHSQVKIKKGEKSTLEKFNLGESRALVSVGMLERGIKLINVHTSFILQVPASDASAMQKASRNLLDDTPRLVLVYFIGTKDEENVRKFANKFSQKYVSYVNVKNT